MRKFLLITLVVLVVVVAGVSWLLSDANRYKPQLVELIHSRTGLAVGIGGDLSWRLWPPVQLVAKDVTADWSADSKEPMLSANTLRLDADLWPLLSKNPKLVIQGVAVDGLRAKLEQHGEHANWMPPGHAGPAVPPLPIPPPVAGGASSGAGPWEVAGVTLNDAVIDYVVDDKARQFRVDALHMSGIAPNKRFPLHAKLTVKDADREIPLNIAATITFDQAVAQWQIDAIDISGSYGNPGPPFQLKADARVNTAAGTLDLQNAHAEIAKVTATFDVTGTELLTSARYSGHLDLPQQSLDPLSEILGTKFDAPVGIKTAFTATEKRVDLADAELHYGPSVVTGKVGTELGTRSNVTFDLATDRFVVPSTKKTALATLGGGSFAVLAFAAPSVAIDPSLDEPLLPMDLIRKSDWNGKIAIGQLVYEGATFERASIVSSNESGAIDANVDLPTFFGGTAATALEIDAHGAVPQWHIVPKLNHVDSQALLAWLDKKYDWIAFFMASSDLKLHGNTRRDLIASLNGHTTFDGGQGMINITEIKNAALAVAKLAGGTDKVNAWPDRLKYQRFTGNWDANGSEHVIDVALDNLTFKAKGKLDTLADDMDLRATVTVNEDPKYQSFKVSSALMGLALPIRCKGSLAAPKCGADEEGTRQLVADALSGKNPEAKARLDKAIDEKVPEQYRDAARSLLEMLNKGKQPPPKSP